MVNVPSTVLSLGFQDM